MEQHFFSNLSKGVVRTLSAAIALPLVLTGCQDEEFGYTKAEIDAAMYSKNFQQMYGEISEDQTWDFSTYNLQKLGLIGGPNADGNDDHSLTRAAIPGLVTTYENQGWYNVSSETTTWLNTHLKEKENNTKYVSSFDWEKSTAGSADPLYVIPIYQGQTGMVWNLELIDIDNNTSTILWHKSENIQYEQNYNQWDEFFYESYNGDQAPYVDEKFTTLKFSSPLSQLPSTVQQNPEIIAAFSVTKDITGSFYITLDGTRTEITKANCSAFFTDTENAKMISDGKFNFITTKNVELGVADQYGNRYLSSNNPNKVYLNVLVDQTINNQKITLDDLKTLEFVIDDASYPKNDQGGIENTYAFYTWSPNRIRVYMKYHGADPKTINLTRDVDEAYQYVGHHTINKYKVQTKPIKIDINKLTGSHFAFNLKTMKRGDGDKDLSELGDDHRSDKGFMSQINDFSETGSPIDADKLSASLKSEYGIDLGATFEYMVIGCEDAGANGKNSDQDYNDVVLLLVGKTLPNQSIKKRYMIEDLGSTYDFDFNDIVVDVTEKVTRTNTGKTYTQTAAIRHLRGTIPFRITIGNQRFGNGSIMRGHNSKGKDYDPSLVDAVKANYIWTHTEVIDNDTKLADLRSNYWNPDANNIYVEVWPSFNSENGNTSDVYWDGSANVEADNSDAIGNNVQLRQIVEFPKQGKVPYIIATDQTVGWMDEHKSIPETWIATHPAGWNNGFEQEIDNSASTGSGTADPKGNKLNNTTSLSDGNITLKNTSTDISSNNTLNIANTVFNDVYLGDYIIVHVDGEKVYDNSRLVFKYLNDGSTIDGIGTNGGIVVTGDYRININDQSFLNSLQANGLQIDGQYVTVTKVTVQSAGGVIVQNKEDIAESSYKLSNQRTVIRSYGNAVILKDEDLQKLYIGDKIVVHVDNLRAESYLGFKKNISQWPSFDYAGGLNISGQENVNVDRDITLTVNANNINNIKNGSGLVINGQYVTIKSVTVNTASGASVVSNANPITPGNSVYNGYTVFSDWERLDISSDKFANLNLGDKIVVHVDNLRGNANSCTSALGMHITSPWTVKIPGFGGNDGNNYSITGDVALEITNENINLIKNGGLTIQGAYVSVSGVSIVPGPKLINGNKTINHGQTYEGLRNDGEYYQNLLDNIDNYSKLTVYFNQTNGGSLNFFTPRKTTKDWDWNPLQQGITTNNQTSYTFDLTTERKNAIKTLAGLIIQYYWDDNHSNESITLTNILLHN